MRTPNRIDTILTELAIVWHSNPDLRLCQILSNASEKVDWGSYDLFYLEDEDLLRGLKKLNKTKNRTF